MSNELLCYIPDDDGYTDDAYVKAMPLMHPEVRIKYRPMRVMERITVQNGLQSQPAKDSELAVAHQIADHIVDWSINVKGGDKAPITAKFILGLKSPLYRRLANIVYFNSEAGDPDPGAEPEQRRTSLREIARAAESGITTAEQDRGN